MRSGLSLYFFSLRNRWAISSFSRVSQLFRWLLCACFTLFLRLLFTEFGWIDGLHPAIYNVGLRRQKHIYKLLHLIFTIFYLNVHLQQRRVNRFKFLFNYFFLGVGCDSCLICLHNHRHHGSFYLINLGPVFGIIFFLVPFRQSIQIVLGRMVRSIVLNFDRCFIHCSSIFTYIQF